MRKKISKLLTLGLTLCLVLGLLPSTVFADDSITMVSSFTEDKKTASVGDIVDVVITIHNGSDTDLVGTFMQIVIAESSMLELIDGTIGVDTDGSGYKIASKAKNNAAVKVGPEIQYYTVASSGATSVYIGDIPSGATVLVTYQVKLTDYSDQNSWQYMNFLYKNHKQELAAQVTLVYYYPVVALVVPSMTKNVESLSSTDGNIRAGDNVRYELVLKNEAVNNSSWYDLSLSDWLPNDISFIDKTVKIDDTFATSGTEEGQYTYDSSSNELTVYLPEMNKQDTTTVTFEAVVSSSASGEIINTAKAIGKDYYANPSGKETYVDAENSFTVFQDPTVTDWTVTYHTSNGIFLNGQNTYSEIVSSETYTVKDSAQLGVSDTVYPDDELIGWYTEWEGKGLEYQPGTVISRPSDGTNTIELYAYWKYVPSTVPTPLVDEVNPDMTKTVESLTSTDGNIRAGDTIKYELALKNDAVNTSSWYELSLTDALPDNIAFTDGTVKIDDTLAAVGTGEGQYTYDSSANVLTVYLPEMVESSTTAVTFEAVVSSSASGKITNTATVAGKDFYSTPSGGEVFVDAENSFIVFQDSTATDWTVIYHTSNGIFLNGENTFSEIVSSDTYIVKDIAELGVSGTENPDDELIGWYTEWEGQGIEYQPGAVISQPTGGTNTIELYAQWQKNIDSSSGDPTESTDKDTGTPSTTANTKIRNSKVDNPKTGDETNLILPIILLISSIGGITFALWRRKKI